MGHDLYGLVLRSSNMDTLKEFYEQTFDIRFEQHTDHGPRHYAGKIGNCIIEIYPAKEPQNSYDSPMIGVDNLQATILRASQKRIHKPATRTPNGLMAILRDTDGRMILLLEKKLQAST